MDIPIEATSFDRGAGDYEKGRPGYPEEALAHLAHVLGLHAGPRVLDLAAGTGKLTRQLVSTGAEVVAVEPVPGMRSVLARVVPEAEVLDGTAEAIPLPGGSVDGVTVGQAFHWFRGREALREIHRVLRPGGGLAVIFNSRDLADPLSAAVDAIMTRYQGATPSHASGAWKVAFTESTLFGPLSHRRFALEQTLDVDGLVSRALSASYIAGLAAEERQRLAEEVRRLVPAGRDHVVLPYSTDVYWCRRLP